MKNSLNIFKEYNDPRIYRNLKIGFACLVVLGILIALAISPGLREDIGISHNHAVGTPKAHHHKTHSLLGTQKPIVRSHQKITETKRTPLVRRTPSKKHKRLEGVKTQHPEQNQNEQESSGNDTGPRPESTPPGSPSPAHPSENNNGDQNQQKNPPAKEGKLKIEAPPIQSPPVVEEVVHGVNETVNGVTGTIGEKTKELPVQVELPKICALTC